MNRPRKHNLKHMQYILIQKVYIKIVSLEVKKKHILHELLKLNTYF